MTLKAGVLSYRLNRLNEVEVTIGIEGTISQTDADGTQRHVYVNETAEISVEGFVRSVSRHEANSPHMERFPDPRQGPKL